MTDNGRHVVGGEIHRYELPEELKKQGLDRLIPVYWQDEDGDKTLMAYVRPGEGQAVVEAFDVAWCDAPTPAVWKMVNEAVMERSEELITRGFQAGLVFCRTGQLPGPQIELEEQQ